MTGLEAAMWALALLVAWYLGRRLGRAEGYVAVNEMQRQAALEVQREAQRSYAEALAKQLGARLSDEDLARLLDQADRDD